MTLPELFRHYLKTQRASSATIKNYVADINHFLGWLTQKTGIRHQIAGRALFGLFTPETLEEYKTDLLENTPLSSLNRRLSALRKFGLFAQSRDWIKNNPALRVKNANNSLKHYQQTSNRDAKNTNHEGRTATRLIESFQKYLEEEKVSQITIKNYLSDLRHFLAWLEAS